MTTDTKQLEQRVADMEKELAALKSVVAQSDRAPWWRQILGQFEGDADYAEIVWLGREMRQAERPE